MPEQLLHGGISRSCTAPRRSAASLLMQPAQLLFGRDRRQDVRESVGAWADDRDGVGHVELGNVDASRRALELLVAGHAVRSAYQIAQVHAWRRDLDLAFEWLGRAHSIRDAGLHQIKFDPVLRNVRGDVRYVDVLRWMHLPPD